MNNILNFETGKYGIINEENIKFFVQLIAEYDTEDEELYLEIKNKVFKECGGYQLKDGTNVFQMLREELNKKLDLLTKEEFYEFFKKSFEYIETYEKNKKRDGYNGYNYIITSFFISGYLFVEKKVTGNEKLYNYLKQKIKESFIRIDSINQHGNYNELVEKLKIAEERIDDYYKKKI